MTYQFINTSKSSFISTLAIETTTTQNLLVTIGNNVYRYFDIPEGVILGLKLADSYGRYLNTAVKPHYRCELVGIIAE